MMFEMRRDVVDTTDDWLKGISGAPPPDGFRHHKPGDVHWMVDGVEVTEAEYERLLTLERSKGDQ